MTPEEIATEIIAARAGRMFYYHRSNNPQYRQDEIDEIAAALTAYGAACAAEEREMCATMAEASIFGRHPELAAHMRRRDVPPPNADQPGA